MSDNEPKLAKPTQNQGPKVAVPQIEAPKVEAHKHEAINAGINAGAFEDAQARLRDGWAKAQNLAQEAFDFNKGTVEIVVKAGKNYGEGLKTLVTDAVSANHAQFDQTTAALRDLANARSFTKIVELQSELARNATQHALTETTKFFEGYFKLTTETFAPLTARAQEAVAKVKVAA